jgi:hypothetical protein
MSKRDPEQLDKLQDAKAWSRLSISELYRLCINGDIESVHLVKPGKSKGIRLIKRKSLENYIQSFMPGGTRYPGSATGEQSHGAKGL